MKKMLIFMVVLLSSLNFIYPCKSAAVELSTGGTIYVPIYRTFYQSYGSSRDAYGLTSTVSLHNTDPKNAIVVYAIEEYDANGKLVKKLLLAPITINPWSSKRSPSYPLRSLMKLAPTLSFAGNLAKPPIPPWWKY